MIRTFAAFLAASALVGAGPAAALHAEHSLTVDLKGLDLGSQTGRATAAARIGLAIDDYCGPTAMAQPLALRRERETCRAVMAQQAREALPRLNSRLDLDFDKCRECGPRTKGPPP